MSHSHFDPIEHPEVQVANGAGYLFVFILEYLAMAACVWLLNTHWLNGPALLILILAIALIVIAVQLYAFFKLNLSEHRIWHTVSLVLTLPLLVITIGLTTMMFITLMHRTMIGGT